MLGFCSTSSLQMFFLVLFNENRPFIFGIPNSSGTILFWLRTLGTVSGAAPARRSHPIGMGLESQRLKKSGQHIWKVGTIKSLVGEIKFHFEG